MKQLVCTALLCIVGCGACGSNTDQAHEVTAESSNGQEARANDHAPQLEPGPPPVARLRVHVADRQIVHLFVESRGQAAAELQTAVQIERQDGDAWQPIGVDHELRASCEEQPARPCVTLVPGAELQPPVWAGLLGDGQCVCTRCVPAPAGHYRFVVTSCDGAHRIESEVFELPP